MAETIHKTLYTDRYTSNNHILLWLAAIIILAVIYAAVLYAPCDDAYIYMVYVKNFFAGHGLTYNGMKVQGFTGPFWIFLLLGMNLLPLSLPTVTELSSVLFGGIVLAETYFLAVRIGIQKQKAVFVPLMLACAGDFVFYMGNGLETHLFTLLLLLSVSYLWKMEANQALRSVQFPFVLTLMALTRPEGVLIAGVLLAFLWFISQDTKGLIRGTALFVAFLFPVLLVLRIYYAYWLPATYYAKSAAGFSNIAQGEIYLLNFLKLYAVPLVFFFYTLIFRFKTMEKKIKIVIFITILWIIEVMMQGGDNMVGFRMYVPILPLIFLVVVYGLSRIQSKLFTLIISIVCLLLFASYNNPFAHGGNNIPIHGHRYSWKNDFTKRKEIGLYIKKNFSPKASIAVNAAGIIPYFAETRTIDMLGLNNGYIAHYGKRDYSLPYGHQAGDGTYVLKNAPDVIVFGGSGQKQASTLLSEREVWAADAFQKQYTPVEISPGIWVYVKKKG